MNKRKLLYLFSLILLMVGVVSPIISSFQSSRKEMAPNSVFTVQSTCSVPSGSVSSPIIEQVRSFIVEDISQYTIDAGEVVANAHFINDLGLTEQQVLDLIALCDTHWSITIPTNCYDSITTVGILMRIIMILTNPNP